MLMKTFGFAICTLLCISKLKSCIGEDEVPLVRVKQGLIKGIKEKSLDGKEFYSYMNIPYAKPPEGKLRFRDPVPLDSWEGELDGTKMPTSCLQGFFFENQLKDGIPITLTGKEDCLRLNVYTPVTNEPGKKLPVMFYIHGGAFIVGSVEEYRPYILLNKDVVMVAIQYRLGIFGFLSMEDSVMPGNMGLKDQQLALKWVKENIEAFGGDSNRITIFGHSAGGASVHYQVLSPGSKGLFNRAIIQSGTALCPWASNKNHRKFAIKTGQEFNCSIGHGTSKYLECMQNVNAHYLAIASGKTNILGLAPLYVLPRVDGEFIDEAPEILMKKGKYNKVDIIAGITRDEGGIDLLFDYLIPKRREIINKNFEKLGPISLYFQDEENSMNLTKQVYRHYLQRNDVAATDEDWHEIVEMSSDRMFRVSHDTVSNFFASDKNIKLYLYQFDHFGQTSIASAFPGFDRKNAITHGDDVVYLFAGGPLLPIKMEDEDDLKVRKNILDSWVNFAETGNPTPSGSDFIWSEATSKSFKHLSLTSSPVMKEDYFQKSRKFWSSLKTSQNMLLKSTFKEEL